MNNGIYIYTSQADLSIVSPQEFKAKFDANVFWKKLSLFQFEFRAFLLNHVGKQVSSEVCCVNHLA